MTNPSPNQHINVNHAKNTISIKASLAATIYQEKPGLYVSHCPALNLYSQGATEAEAQKNIIEATELFIESCIEDHTLEKVLEECGFSPAGHPVPKKQSAGKTKLSPCSAAAKQINFPAEIPMAAYNG